jgi:hypothetical protein
MTTAAPKTLSIGKDKVGLSVMEEESQVSRHSGETEIVATSDENALAETAEPPVPQIAGGVRFGQVRIHTHKNILGDNPSVSAGLPITLDWDVLSSDHFNLEEYELDKLCQCGDEKANKANDKNMAYSNGRRPTRIPASRRYEIIRAAGHSRSSLNRVHSEIQQIKEMKRRARAEQGIPSNPAPAWLRWIASRRASTRVVSLRKARANPVV